MKDFRKLAWALQKMRKYAAGDSENSQLRLNIDEQWIQCFVATYKKLVEWECVGIVRIVCALQHTFTYYFDRVIFSHFARFLRGCSALRKSSQVARLKCRKWKRRRMKNGKANNWLEEGGEEREPSTTTRKTQQRLLQKFDQFCWRMKFCNFYLDSSSSSFWFAFFLLNNICWSRDLYHHQSNALYQSREPPETSISIDFHDIRYATFQESSTNFMNQPACLHATRQQAGSSRQFMFHVYSDKQSSCAITG